MAGKKIGYVRVSSVDQNTARQLDGITLDKKFVDKCSGKDRVRPQLNAMLAYVREGDIIIVHSMDRLARNTIDLVQIVKDLTAAQIQVEFLISTLRFRYIATGYYLYIIVCLF